jgi:hypothetical protein
MMPRKMVAAVGWRVKRMWGLAISLVTGYNRRRQLEQMTAAQLEALVYFGSNLTKGDLSLIIEIASERFKGEPDPSKRNLLASCMVEAMSVYAKK